jgi:phosphoglycolate phosphatase-like HAD superfamily hydrolase
MAVKAVLFDIDGTLVDSNEFHVLAWDEAIRNAGRAVGRDALRIQIGKGSDNLLPSLFPDAGTAQRQAMAKDHGDIIRERYLPQVKAFPGATELIARLHESGIKVLLASSAGQSDIEHYIELLGIRELLTATVSADDVAKSKPYGDIFACALKKVFPLEAQEVFAVGDTPYDVESAAKCHIRTIAVLSGGFSKDDLQDAGAVALYVNVKELLDELDRSPLAPAVD